MCVREWRVKIYLSTAFHFMISQGNSMVHKLAHIIFCSTIAFFLVACGGGGSEPAAPATPVLPTGLPVTVQGSISYERITSLPSGALDYANITALPVRGAKVELLSGTTVLSSVQSSATGQYAFTNAPANSLLSIRVRAELKQTSTIARWDVSVMDNTNGNALYALDTGNFNSASGITRHILAGSGWDGSGYGSARSAAPFAILDTVYQSQQKVLSVDPTAIFPPLQLFWSINNAPSTGDLRLGLIGTSFFQEELVGSVMTRQLYILGKENVDTDEYDTSVVAHEWGHYYQSAFSRDDSPGGSHGGSDDRLDRRVAFSEGWGNAWSGIASNRSVYRDSSGVRQSSGFAFDLNTGYARSGPKGWYREGSVQYILWDLHRQAGFGSIHSTLSGSIFKNGLATTHIHSFAAALKSTQAGTVSAALNGLLADENINTFSNAFGNNETNNGGSSLTLPMYRTITVWGSPSVTISGGAACVTSDFDAFGDANKLGRFVYITFNVSAAGMKSIQITANALLADTDFELRQAGGTLIGRFEAGVSNVERANVNLAAGNYVLIIYDFNNITSSPPCFTVAMQ